VPPDPFEGLSAFLAVAERKSFTRAAADLGVSAQAVSQTIRTLERRLGLLLFQRTTRRVGLTEAGKTLLQSLRPAANQIVDAVDALQALRDKPGGQLRLSISRVTAQVIIEPIVRRMRETYPDISIDLHIDNAPPDLTARGFDAGIAIADWVEADMVRVPLTPEIVWMVVGSPGYLALRGEPSRPEHLAKHECIRYRLPTTGAVYRWEFVRSGRTFSIDVPGSITVTEGPVTYAFARQGLGLTYAPDFAITDDLAAGRLQRVLEPFSLRTAGLYLYFPARAQSQPKLRAFIDLATSTARALDCSHRCPR
jgi:DNA-binding transcriptional LysR family regulator